PGDREVADVMSGLLCPRSVLPPSGDPRVDQPRVSFDAHVWANAQTLGDPRPVRIDQHVRLIDQRQQRFGAAWLFGVKDDGPSAPHADRPGNVWRLAWALDSHDFRSQVGQHPTAHWPRTDPSELDHA